MKGQAALCGCLVKEFSHGINLPVFKWIINAMAMKTEEVNRIYLADSETKSSDNSDLGTGQSSG